VADLHASWVKVLRAPGRGDMCRLATWPFTLQGGDPCRLQTERSEGRSLKDIGGLMGQCLRRESLAMNGAERSGELFIVECILLFAVSPEFNAQYGFDQREVPSVFGVLFRRNEVCDLTIHD